MVGEVMEKNITGTMFYYYFVCKRKLWYFSQNIFYLNFEYYSKINFIIIDSLINKNI